ncbi:hypothetical protein WJX81_002198 [Elliptochloris bilobata]|uniref:Myb-like domain-containing protein n=1 Tax=Elliptochloris bilobata TaxID=381761 RepID=A0AAW1RGE1_9CHLO
MAGATMAELEDLQDAPLGVEVQRGKEVWAGTVAMADGEPAWAASAQCWTSGHVGRLWATTGLGEVLLPAALACADRVDVSRGAWEAILRRRWDGRVLLVRPRAPGGLFAGAQHHGGELDPAYCAFYEASVAAAAGSPGEGVPSQALSMQVVATTPHGIAIPMRLLLVPSEGNDLAGFVFDALAQDAKDALRAAAIEGGVMGEGGPGGGEGVPVVAVPPPEMPGAVMPAAALELGGGMTMAQLSALQAHLQAMPPGTGGMDNAQVLQMAMASLPGLAQSGNPQARNPAPRPRRPKREYEPAETEAIIEGCRRYATSTRKWHDIMKDEELRSRLAPWRTNVDLKDRWRSLVKAAQSGDPKRAGGHLGPEQIALILTLAQPPPTESQPPPAALGPEAIAQGLAQGMPQGMPGLPPGMQLPLGMYLPQDGGGLSMGSGPMEGHPAAHPSMDGHPMGGHEMGGHAMGGAHEMEGVPQGHPEAHLVGAPMQEEGPPGDPAPQAQEEVPASALT